MMWIVYNCETARVYGKFYTKKRAKEFIQIDAARYQWFKNTVGLEKIDIMKFDKWQTWKLLMAEETQ